MSSRMQTACTPTTWEGAIPLVQSLPASLTVPEALQRLWDLPYCCLLESSMTMEGLGRYSFLCADPSHVVRLDRPAADPMAPLARLLEQYRTAAQPDLPPFQGGVAGLLGYEFGRCFERIPAARHNEFDLPLAVLGLYDVVLAWDHAAGQCWLISQGIPESTPERRAERALARQQDFFQRLSGPPRIRTPFRSSPHATAHGLTAPQFETRLGGEWLGNFDSQGYRSAVQRAKDYIHAGDVFQVNLAQRLLHRAPCHAVELYLQMRHVNAAPFAAYMDLGEAQVVSASPERFLCLRDGWVESRPIKGTRKRTGDQQQDQARGRELLECPKDRAENTMIVDLLRNDLSRVCDPFHVRVPELCQLESYPYVLHLVSSIQGRLREDATAVDLIAATFPGGSITGAPKIRAMEIIAELEPTVRGPYCGSLGYLGLDGSMDLNILIRTVTACRGWWQLQVGGGITSDSQPECEEEETWVKAAGLVAGIEQACRGME